jgi:trehalose/maltose transport system permease protein
MAFADSTRSKPQNQATNMGIYFVAGIFLLLGAAALIWLFSSITNDPRIISAAEGGRGAGAVILAFLNSTGIIIPAVIIILGIFSILLAFQLLQRDINAAAWAQSALMWLVIAGIVYALQGITAGAFNNVIVAVVAIAVFGLGYWWLQQNQDFFVGEQNLMASSTRTAWNLLLPTVIILIVVAARPLEQTFIASLTNQEFGTGQSEEDVQFVGLANYGQLLGIRLDAIPCEVDEATGGCATNADGEIEYVSLRDAIGDELYRGQGYRAVNEFNLFGQQYTLSSRDRDFAESIGNTLYFTFFSVVIELILGVFIAMVVNSKFSGRGLLRAAMLVPWAIPTVVSARLWQVMLRDNQSGLINAFLLNLGLIQQPFSFLANSDLQIPTLVAIDVWKTTPFMALIILAGLQVIPSDIYEAADVDGASKVRQFFQITLPLLRPTIAVALVFRTLDAVRVFDVFNVLLQRQKYSMATYNYETLISNQQFGYASAVGVVIFIIILIFTFIYVRSLGVNAE